MAKMTTLADPRKRTKILRVRCSEEEFSRWQAVAKSRDGTVSGMVRRLLDGTPEKRREVAPPVDVRLLRHVSLAGNNLNQIARVVNEARVIDAHADARDILGHLVILERLLRQLIEENSG